MIADEVKHVAFKGPGFTALRTEVETVTGPLLSSKNAVKDMLIPKMISKAGENSLRLDT